MPITKPLNRKSQVKQYTQADVASYPAATNKLNAFYDAIVGSVGQVNSGAATHSSIQAAHNFLSSGGNILVLEGTYTENVTISKTIRIIGQGHGSQLNGTITYATGATFCSIELMRFIGNITFNAASNGNFMIQCWLAPTFTLTDNGTANYKLIVGE